MREIFVLIGLTPSLQKRAFTGTSLDAFQINFIVGVFGLAYALVMLACSGETISTVHFFLANPAKGQQTKQGATEIKYWASSSGFVRHLFGYSER